VKENIEDVLLVSNIFRAIFPTAKIAGCLFHLVQSVQRHMMRDLGLRGKFV